MEIPDAVFALGHHGCFSWPSEVMVIKLCLFLFWLRPWLTTNVFMGEYGIHIEKEYSWVWYASYSLLTFPQFVDAA